MSSSPEKHPPRGKSRPAAAPLEDASLPAPPSPPRRRRQRDSAPARPPGPKPEGLLAVGVNPKGFLERFRAVSRFAARWSPVPILETVQLEATPDGKGWLHAGGLDAACSLAVPLLKAVSPGAAQLSREQVIGALKEARGGSVTFEALATEGPVPPDASAPSRKLAVRTPRGVVMFATFDSGAFPRRAPEAPTATVTLPAWRLSRALGRTLYACDPDNSRFALGGVSLESSEGTLRAVATDGRCLAEATESATGPGLEPPRPITSGDEERPLAPLVPLAAVQGLMEVLKVIDPNRPLTVGFSATGWFELRGEGLSLSARLPEGRFPAWRACLPPESPCSARVDPRRFEVGLKALARLTTQGDRAMTLTLRGPTLTLSVANAAASSARVVPVGNLSADPGEAVSAAVDPDVLLPYLAAQRAEFVLRFPPGEGWPLLCESEGFRFLVMPMEEER